VCVVLVLRGPSGGDMAWAAAALPQAGPPQTKEPPLENAILKRLRDQQAIKRIAMDSGQRGCRYASDQPPTKAYKSSESPPWTPTNVIGSMYAR